MSWDEQGAIAASEFRTQHGLGIAPIADTAELLEEVLGCDIAVMQMPDGVDALTRLDPVGGGLLIAISTSDNPERQRFSTLHELSHVLFSDFIDQAIGRAHPTGPAETRAHSFARNTLAPLEAVQALVDRTTPGTSWERVVAAGVRHFGVSPRVLTIQLRTLEQLSHIEADTLADRPAAWYARRFGWEEERVALVEDSQRERMPQRLVANANDAYQAKKLSIQRLARVRNVTGDLALFEHQLASDGLAPTPPSIAPSTTPSFGDDW